MTNKLKNIVQNVLEKHVCAETADSVCWQYDFHGRIARKNLYISM